VRRFKSPGQAQRPLAAYGSIEVDFRLRRHRLSPLVHHHINFQGRYSFALLEAIARGELRPLRDPIAGCSGRQQGRDRDSRSRPHGM